MTYPTSKILVVEEEPVLREITAFRLELLGYRVAATDTAQQANQWLATELPQLILIGNTTETDPFEFLNHLSNEPRTSQIPVIYLSASSDLDDVQKAYNAGADEFLVIPYDPLVLETKVNNLLGVAV